MIMIIIWLFQPAIQHIQHTDFIKYHFCINICFYKIIGETL